MTVKEKFTYTMFAIDLIILIAWPFLVFFPFIVAGLIIGTISCFFGLIIYAIYRAGSTVEHKIVPTQTAENKPN